MSKFAHRFYLSVLAIIVITTLFFLIYRGMPYYSLSLDDRVYDPDHAFLKPSGIIGHGIGIAGSLFMIIGMSSYMARKRFRFLSRLGSLKYWLEFHIFLCTLGPILVLYHTTFKIRGNCRGKFLEYGCSSIERNYRAVYIYTDSAYDRRTRAQSEGSEGNER